MTLSPPRGAAARPRLVFSLADQNFEHTKSIGIFNTATQLGRHLAPRPEFSSFHVLINRTLREAVSLPATAGRSEHDLPLRGRWGRILWDQWALYRTAARLRADWLFLPKGFASFSRRSPTRLAAYVHDTMAYHYLRHHLGVLSQSELRYFCWSLSSTLRQASIVFTISQFTADQLRAFGAERGLKLPTILVGGIGFEARETPPAGRREGLLVLTSPWPHKRTDLAIDYIRRWQQDRSAPVPVTCVGGLPPSVPSPAHLGWTHHARLPEPDYRTLIQRSQGLVYFSEFEGFGMPPVEAVVAGVCPVYSDIPAIREVMLGLGCPFENADYTSFAAAMDRALLTPPAEIAAWREALLREHHWPSIAERVATRLVEATVPPGEHS